MADTAETTTKLIGAMLALALANTAFAADWKFGAGVSAGETYTDNVALAPPGAAQSDWITQITPTFSAVKNGARFKADVRYSLQNLFYARDSNRNQIYHQLDARANTELYEKELFLDTNASIRQAATSPLGATGVNNTNATGNISNVRTLTVSPYWIHRFGSVATMNARVGVSDVGYSNASISNSTNTNTSMTLAGGSAFSQTPWALNYSDQKVNYTSRPDVEFTTTSASLGYLITPRIKLTGVTGYERNQYLYTGSAPQGSFWEANVAWAISPRTKLEVGLGNHYYGKTKLLSFSTHGGHLEWKADYNESVTTSNSQASTNTAYLVTSGGAPVGIFVDPTQIQTNSVFLNKRFQTALIWTRGRSAISANVYHSSQIALETGQVSSLLQNGAFQNTTSIKQRGVSAGWSYQLTPLMSANLSASLARSSYPGLGREDEDKVIQLGINRNLSPHLSGAINVRHQARDSNQSGADYTENALSGSVNYTF